MSTVGYQFVCKNGRFSETKNNPTFRNDLELSVILTELIQSSYNFVRSHLSRLIEA